jgi:hypothetical protein
MKFGSSPMQQNPKWSGEQFQIKKNRRELPDDMRGRQADALLHWDVDQEIPI